MQDEGTDMEKISWFMYIMGLDSFSVIHIDIH